jgi:osmotically-inducible protein OsmY
MRIAESLSALSIAAFITGCASTHTPYVYSTPSGQVISTGPARNPSDVALDTSIRAELNQYGDLAADSPNVQVYSQNGVVNLTGTVRNDRERAMLVALVRNSDGVAGVNDQLRVSYPPTGGPEAPRVYSTPPAPVVTPPPDVVVPGATVIPGPAGFPQVRASTATDQALANRIVDRLRWDSVSNRWLQNATITVNNSDVYLQGYLNGSREHDAILYTLQHTPGIRNIYDESRVR